MWNIALPTLLFSLLSAAVIADHNRFDPGVDYSHLDWFDRGLYKASLPFQDCIDLLEFYAYADSNPYDNLNRDDIKSYTYQLGYGDLTQLSAENPSDSITPDDFSKVEDLHCSTLPEFQKWRAPRPSFSDDDYFHVFDYQSRQDFDERDRHYPVNDYYPVNDFHYPSPAYGLIRPSMDGGYASWVPFSWWEQAGPKPAR